jgi:hypothetical protein
MIKSYFRPVFYLSLLLLLLGMVKDLRLTLNFSGAALRNRIVSARYMHEGKDPYFSKWKEGMSDRFLDPIDSPELQVNRCTVPPSLLLLHEPLGMLPYPYIKIIWFLLEMAALGFIVLLFCQLAESKEERQVIVIVSSLFIVGSDSWHLHVERGQMYIFYAFLLALAYWFSQKKFRFNMEGSGFILGLSAWIRPTFILMDIPFLIAGKWKMIKGNLLGLFTGFLISVIAGQKSAWQSYFKAMSIWGHAQMEGMPLDLSFSNIKYPAAGEGTDLSLWGMDYDMEFFSVQALAKQYLGLNLSSFVLMLIFLSLLLLLAIYFRSIRTAGDRSLFIFGFLILMLSEYFLPAPRASYNYVQWVFLLLLILKELRPDQKLIIIMLAAGILLNMSFNWIPNNKTIGEMALWVGGFLVLRCIKTVTENSNSKQ